MNRREMLCTDSMPTQNEEPYIFDPAQPATGLHG
jgi:hypothetical protein